MPLFSFKEINMANKYLLIDGNSLGYAAQSSSKLTVGGEEVQAIFGFLRSLQKVLKNYPGYTPTVLWDGRAQWRFDLFPLYKDGRLSAPEKVAERDAYRAQKPKILKVVSMLGVRQITDTEAEADDLAGYFARSLSRGRPDNHVAMISGDQDWCQLITENVSWHDIRYDKKCNHRNFEEFTGFKTPKQFVEAKCITGDTSDNIPGIGGIGEKGVIEFFRKYDSVEEFFIAMKTPYNPEEKHPPAHLRFARNERPVSSKKYGAMMPMRDAFNRNMELMELADYIPKKSTLIVDDGCFDLIEFREFLEDRLFKSIIAQLDNWVIPFEKLKGVKI